MKRFLYYIMIVVLLGNLSGIAQDSGTRENQKTHSRLTLPWQDFKELLHLDDREIIISIETFETLLKQTGVKTKPEHTIKNGNVVLSRQAFTDLVNRMKPPMDPDEHPPFDYLITKALYQGKMQSESTRFTAEFVIHVLKKNGYVRIPLLPASIALEDVRLNRHQTLIVDQNGYHTMLLNDPGVYQVQAKFSMESSLMKGPHRIDLQIQKTPITLIELEIPLKHIDVEIPQAQHLRATEDGNRTRLYGILSSGNQISIRWRKKLAVTEKVPPKLYAEVHHLISIEDDALKTNSEILLNILHSEIENVQLMIPENLNVLSVSGEGVGEWQEASQQNRRILHVPFTYSKKGSMSIFIVTEAPFDDGRLSTTFEGFQLLDAVRETGFIGIELNTSAEVNVSESSNLEKIPIQKLPQRLYDKSKKPMILGFKYLKHPYHFILGVEKHEKIAVPVAAVESANTVTLFTEDGKVVHRLVYQVRNSAKQFLELEIPEKADVWSVFVGNEPVECSLNSDGHLLIPLIRSKSVNNRLNAFPVEVILCVVQNPFQSLKILEVQLPHVDLLISQILWSVYLPNDYTYWNFRSTLEKEELIRGINVFARSKRIINDRARQKLVGSGEMESYEMPEEALEKVYEGKKFRSQFRNVPVDEEQMKSQVANELQFSDRLGQLSRQEAPGPAAGSMSTGVLPIQIKIPTSGQVYRFAKTIIQSEDPLKIRVTYMRHSIVMAIRWICTLFILLILYLFRRVVARILSFIRQGWMIAEKSYQKIKPVLRKMGQSWIFLFTLLAFGFVILMEGVMIGGIIVFLAVLLIGKRILEFLEKHRKK